MFVVASTLAGAFWVSVSRHLLTTHDQAADPLFISLPFDGAGMDCHDCGEPTVRGRVPGAYREYAPEDAAVIAVCTNCLTVVPADEAEESPDWAAVSDALPRDDRAVPALLLVGLLDSLATNRAAIEALVGALERDGVDAFATIDRLAADGGLDPATDLDRRRHQLEQLL